MEEEGISFSQALRKCGLTPQEYLRALSYSETLPWESLDPCFPKDYLIEEHKKAFKQIKTPPCSVKCSRCGVCAN
jgi:hypothetical protein